MFALRATGTDVNEPKSRSQPSVQSSLHGKHWTEKGYFQGGFSDPPPGDAEEEAWRNSSFMIFRSSALLSCVEPGI